MKGIISITDIVPPSLNSLVLSPPPSTRLFFVSSLYLNDSEGYTSKDAAGLVSGTNMDYVNDTQLRKAGHFGNKETKLT